VKEGKGAIVRKKNSARGQKTPLSLLPTIDQSPIDARERAARSDQARVRAHLVELSAELLGDDRAHVREDGGLVLLFRTERGRKRGEGRRMRKDLEGGRKANPENAGDRLTTAARRTTAMRAGAAVRRACSWGVGDWGRMGLGGRA